MLLSPVALAGESTRPTPPEAATATAAPPSTPVPVTTPGIVPDGTPGAPVSHPLPEIVATIPPDIPTVSLEPESQPQLEVGRAIRFTLGHCGLLSPIDLDGSFWRPVAGADVTGGAIESDDAVGELISATAGAFRLLEEEVATFTTTTGSVIALARAPGAVDYPLCM